MKEYVQIGKYTYGFQDNNVIDIFFKKYYDLIGTIE